MTLDPADRPARRRARPPRGPSRRPRRAADAALGLLAGLAAFATLAVIGDAPTASAAAPAKPAVTFGIAPASSTGPDGRSYFSLGATPGAGLGEHVAVTNYSYQPLTLTLHASDATNTAQGDLALLPPTSPAPRLGSWVSLPPAERTVVVGPRATVVVPFTLRVPPGATPGDHVGGLLATLQSAVTGPSGQRINLLQSIGTRIFVRVSGPLHPRLSIGGLRVHYLAGTNPFGAGTVALGYTVTNTGNVGLGGVQTVSVSGLFGNRTYARRVPRVPLLLPGSSLSEKVDFGGVFPTGLMTARVSISPLVIPGSVQPPSGPFRADRSFWALPVGLVAVVAAALVLAAATLMLRRWRRARANRAGPSGASASGSDEPTPPSPPQPVAPPTRSAP